MKKLRLILALTLVFSLLLTMFPVYAFEALEPEPVRGVHNYIQIDELEVFFVNRGCPALSDATLTRTGVWAYDVTATEAANAADLFFIVDDGTAATTNLLAAGVAVPLDDRGYPVRRIEIDPAFAFDAASLAERLAAPGAPAVDPAGDILLSL